MQFRLLRSGDGGSIAAGKGQNILVVEDDEQVRSLVIEVLTELGYTIHAVPTADEAIKLLETEKLFDLLLTDVGLPGLNGRQLADVARLKRPALPVLFMTGYAGVAATQEEFLDSKMALISKPFSLERLSVAIEHLL